MLSGFWRMRIRRSACPFWIVYRCVWHTGLLGKFPHRSCRNLTGQFAVQFLEMVYSDRQTGKDHRYAHCCDFI